MCVCVKEVCVSVCLCVKEGVCVLSTAPLSLLHIAKAL